MSRPKKHFVADGDLDFGQTEHFSRSEVSSRVDAHLARIQEAKIPQRQNKKAKRISCEPILSGDSRNVSRPKTALVIYNRNDLAKSLHVQKDKVYRAATCGWITPDFVGTDGTPFFSGARLTEISRILKTPEVVAQP